MRQPTGCSDAGGRSYIVIFLIMTSARTCTLSVRGESNREGHPQEPTHRHAERSSLEYFRHESIVPDVQAVAHGIGPDDGATPAPAPAPAPVPSSDTLPVSHRKYILNGSPSMRHTVQFFFGMRSIQDLQHV